MKWKWFVTSVAALLVVGLVTGCSEDTNKPVSPKVSQRDEAEAPFDEDGVKGKMFGGSHNYGRVRLAEMASRARVARLVTKLDEVGYERCEGQSLLIEGQSEGTEASVAYLAFRSRDTPGEWVIVAIVESQDFYTFGAAVYSRSPMPADRGAKELREGLWTAPVATIAGPSVERWNSAQWDDFLICMGVGVSTGIVSCMIDCIPTGPGWFTCTKVCSGWSAMRSAITCAGTVALKTQLGGYGKDPSQK